MFPEMYFCEITEARIGKGFEQRMRKIHVREQGIFLARSFFARDRSDVQQFRNDRRRRARFKHHQYSPARARRRGRAAHDRERRVCRDLVRDVHILPRCLLERAFQIKQRLRCIIFRFRSEVWNIDPRLMRADPV